jgi:large subunit ribosomal protein L18
MKLITRTDKRRKRHSRVRRKVHGTADCPRMAVMVSAKNIYVQFIDDDSGVTLAAASTISVEKKKNLESATALGQRAVAEANKAGIKKVVIDRGGHQFHGRVKAVVDEVVKAGMSPASKSDVENKEEQ